MFGRSILRSFSASRIWQTAVILLAVGIGGGIGYFYSVFKQSQNIQPPPFVQKAVRGYGALFLKDVPEHRIISTNRLDLSITAHFLPFELKNGGGGIASDGHEGVLIVDLEGKVFHFKDGLTRRLDIVAPSSGRDALSQQLDAGLLGDIRMNFGHFRFNDVLLHDIGTVPHILLSFTRWDQDRLCFASVLAKAAIGTGRPADWHIRPEDWSVVHETEPCLVPFTSGFGIRGAEAGGRLAAFGADRVLWTIGAYGYDDDYDKSRPETALAQNPETDYGKLLNVNLATGEHAHLAFGLRNPQGVATGSDGAIYLTDHGMRGGDELNFLTHRANFGFPLVTLGTKYTRAPGGSEPYHAGHLGFDAPLMAFSPSIAPTSVLSLSTFDPNWREDVLLGGLKHQLVRVHLQNGVAILSEPINIGLRVRDMVQSKAKEIVLLTSEKKIAVLEPKLGQTHYDRLRVLLLKDERSGRSLDLLHACLQCHGLEEGEQAGAGPNLFGVCGQEPGATDFAHYSGALPAAVARWDTRTLEEFIVDPQGLAPGNSMDWPGLAERDIAAHLAEALCAVPD